MSEPYDVQTELEERLAHALEASLKLQSHYAHLLNIYDGGKRLEFKSVQEWLDRIEESKK